MTDFNALPLSEQLKQLQPGDELHLHGGGWLPFVEYQDARNYYKISSHKDEACNTLEWTQSGTYLCSAADGFCKPHSMDIIRVVRPAPKEQCTFPKCDGSDVVDDCCHKPRENCRFPGKDCQASIDDSSCWALCGGLSPAPKERAARKVPEVVGELRRILREHDSPHNPLMEIVRALADHFERGEQP